MIPVDVFVWTGVGLALALPLIWVVRSERKVTWTSAVPLSMLLGAIFLILIGDVPSRVLYYFDAQHETLSTRFPILGFMESDFGGTKGYVLVRDIVGNTVQGVFFVIMVALAYLWGEHHRRNGRFKS